TNRFGPRSLQVGTRMPLPGGALVTGMAERRNRMKFDETFDLVIVGSGCASVTAALAAKSMGGSAVILEKQELFGGSTAYSGGIAWIPNNPLLDDDSEDAARTYLNHVVGPPDKASPVAKREMFLKE